MQLVSLLTVHLEGRLKNQRQSIWRQTRISAVQIALGPQQMDREVWNYIRSEESSAVETQP